jgi:type 1 fimbria pilin
MINIIFKLAFLIYLIPQFAAAQTSETRSVGSFNGVESGGSFETRLQRGDEESVKITAEGIDPKKVYLQKGSYRNIKVKVLVTFKNLESISNSGSGSLISESEFSAKSMKLSFSGSGNASLKGKIKADETNIQVSGSGSVNLGTLETGSLNLAVSGSGELQIASGIARSENIQISGSGSLNAFGLQSETCAIAVSGSGSASLTVTKTLDGSVSGSGNVNYKGDAAIVNSTIRGSGRIHKK